MRESFWGLFAVLFGIMCIAIIFIFQSITNTDERMYNNVKEVTEAAMFDSLDLTAYRSDYIVRIDEQKFVESFLRRFAESASLTKTYKISIYDINEEPPKVSLKVTTKAGGALFNGYGDSQMIDIDITNRIDAILETTY